MIPGVSKDQEALLIALKRPIIFVLPAAFDKGMKFLYVWIVLFDSGYTAIPVILMSGADVFTLV